jgi:hypothetical protein
MSSEHNGLNDRQEAFVGYYLKNPNATNAARLAGYQGNAVTLASTGYELLRNPQIRAEIDRLRKERKLTAGDVLGLIEGTATVDITPYLREDSTLDVQALAAAGLGYLVEGVKPGRNGTEIALASPQAARKILARHHKILGADTQVDVSASLDLAAETVQALAEQIAAIQGTEPEEQDDA